MKVKDIIKDDKFNEFLGYEIEAYNNRPAPQEGCRSPDTVRRIEGCGNIYGRRY